MSKIGEKPVPLPATVTVQIAGSTVQVKGKEGEISFEIPKVLSVKTGDNNLTIERTSDKKSTKSLHGLYRSLLANAVLGVEKLWEKRLEVVGTGFNVRMQGEDLAIKVGYSHIVIFKKQQGVSYAVEGNNKIIVSGINKQLVGEVAYQIKIIKKPDVYKGKGIRYEGEKVRIKPGKKVKTTV